MEFQVPEFRDAQIETGSPPVIAAMPPKSSLTGDRVPVVVSSKRSSPDTASWAVPACNCFVIDGRHFSSGRFLHHQPVACLPVFTDNFTVPVG